MKIISDEQIAEIIFLLNNHQTMAAKIKLSNLEELKEKKDLVSIDTPI